MIGSYGTFGEARRRRRQQAWSRVVRFLSAVLAVLAVGIYAYQVGVSANQARTTQLEADLVRFRQDNLDLRDRAAMAAKLSADANAALESMRQRYAAEIPSGQAADLLAQLREQLAAGVEPERLALLIEAAGLEDACQSEPVTKRFMPRTSISAEPLSWVRFHDRIIVTGQGEAARNEAGLAEAWYDPAQPVRLEFRTLDGAITNVEGIVPFTHRMVVDGKEYRFSAVRGETRFLEVTAQACALPEPDDDSRAAQDQERPRADAPGSPLLIE
jgi:hypothetical protein